MVTAGSTAPDFQVGDRVFDSRHKRYGIISSAGAKTNTWIVKWDNADQRRKKATDQQYLQLVSPSQPPVAYGQRVVIRAGSNANLEGTTVARVSSCYSLLHLAQDSGMQSFVTYFAV